MRNDLDRALDRNPDYPPGFRYEELETDAEDEPQDDDAADDPIERWNGRPETRPHKRRDSAGV